jgi:hypothetical protein
MNTPQKHQTRLETKFEPNTKFKREMRKLAKRISNPRKNDPVPSVFFGNMEITLISNFQTIKGPTPQRLK